MFQHTATRRWLLLQVGKFGERSSFNTQPPEGGCIKPGFKCLAEVVSTHSHPKVAASIITKPKFLNLVSTHSHPKVAAASGGTHRNPLRQFQHTATRRWLPSAGLSAVAASSFNTQPPEGGCPFQTAKVAVSCRFNTQPPEGGCAEQAVKTVFQLKVSTHSHPKVAAIQYLDVLQEAAVSTHSHPKVAAPRP